MSKKNKNKQLQGEPMEEVLEEEVVEAQEESAPEEVPAPAADLVEFDSWWALRSPKIPRHHYKEIIKADMKARGMQKLATLAQYDEALAKYGIKL